MSGDGPAPMLCFPSEKWGESRGDQSAPTSSFQQSRFPATVEARPSELVRVDSKDLHRGSF